MLRCLIMKDAPFSLLIGNESLCEMNALVSFSRQEIYFYSKTAFSGPVKFNIFRNVEHLMMCLAVLGGDEELQVSRLDENAAPTAGNEPPPPVRKRRRKCPLRSHPQHYFMQDPLKWLRSASDFGTCNKPETCQPTIDHNSQASWLSALKEIFIWQRENPYEFKGKIKKFGECPDWHYKQRRRQDLFCSKCLTKHPSNLDCKNYKIFSQELTTLWKAGLHPEMCSKPLLNWYAEAAGNHLAAEVKPIDIDEVDLVEETQAETVSAVLWWMPLAFQD